MATTDERVDKLEFRFSTLEQQVSIVAAKVDMLVIESQQQREDIRRAQEKHDADIKATNAKIDAKFDALIKQIHDNFIQTLIGVGAIMAAIGGLLFTALK